MGDLGIRVVIKLQREPTVRCAETIERSGEELGPVSEILVGSSSLRRPIRYYL